MKLYTKQNIILQKNINKRPVNGHQSVLKRLTVSLILIILILAIDFTNIIVPLKFLNADTLEQQLENVKKQRENTRKEIEKAKKAEADYSNQVNKIETNLLGSLKELDSLNTQLSNTKTEMDRLTIELVIKRKELADVEEELRQKTVLLNERVATIYKSRTQDLLELFIEPVSFTDFFSKLKLMNLVAQQDIDILNEVQNKRDKAENLKQNMEDLKNQERDRKQDLEKLVDDSAKKTREIEEIYNEKKELLSETRANKESLLKMEEALASKEKEITKKLEALRYGNAPGKFLYPLKGGILTSGFGNRISPITGMLRFHSGVDIGASSGVPVMAAASGEVINAEYMGGYGYAIIIYHGGGFSTLYGHLSGFAVSAGQKVKQGQIIGYVGSTGFATGPHLHFEVRVNGAARNPYSYF
jgi:murein DD-endopeptidase MepM/ murein hydrolase activator NlpD